MTLGQLIEALKAVEPDRIFKNGFGEPDSWRGSYDELAFEPAQNVTAKSMLDHALFSLGKTFTGYKGGSYLMTNETPVNIDHYGFYSGDDAPISTHRWQLMLAESSISGMTQTEQIAALQASESIKHANLQELARLVLEFDREDLPMIEIEERYSAMINFAKGVAQ